MFKNIKAKTEQMNDLITRAETLLIRLRLRRESLQRLRLKSSLKSETM